MNTKNERRFVTYSLIYALSNPKRPGHRVAMKLLHEVETTSEPASQNGLHILILTLRGPDRGVEWRYQEMGSGLLDQIGCS
jgi:hypothetical protein